MARKTDGTTPASRRKTATPPAEAAAVQPASEQLAPKAVKPEVRNTEVRGTEVRRNVTPINTTPTKVAPKKAQPSVASLDEEIRRRAYELFLERKGAAGDPAADWIVAEREVRARHTGQESAFAAHQGS